jgi:two-component system, chemotaxis family, sensor kinase CheA
MDATELARRMMALFKTESMAGLMLLASGLDSASAGSAATGAVSAETMFRTLHTLRGSAAMNGLDEISELACALEDLWDQVRKGWRAWDAQVQTLTHTSVALLRDMLEVRAIDAQLLANALTQLAELTATSTPAVVVLPTTSAPFATSTPCLFAIDFEPCEDLMRRGVDVLALIDELGALGTLAHVPLLDTLPALSALEPDRSYLKWRMLLLTGATQDAVDDVFMFVAADSRVDVVCLNDAVPETWRMPPHVRALLRERSSEPATALLPALGLVATAGDELVLETSVVLQEPEQTFIPVPVARLNRQIDLVGELVIAQSTLMRVASTSKDPHLQAVVEHVMRLTTDMRDNAMGLRMVPVGTLLNTLETFVSGLTQDSGITLRFVATGHATELDMAVTKALQAPVMQLLRECVVHCQESSDVSSWCIHVSFAKVGDEALFQVDAQGSDRRFDEPLDLRRAVEGLRGSLEIVHVVGRGTQFTMRLPLTQGIIEGLLVSIHANNFVLPLAMVEEVMDLKAAMGSSESNQNILNLRGRLVPFVRLAEFFEMDSNATPSNEGHAIIVTGGGRSVGVLVDRVIGQQQTVIKNTSSLYRDNPVLAGATILADGTVALILDVMSVLRLAEKEIGDLHEH